MKNSKLLIIVFTILASSCSPSPAKQVDNRLTLAKLGEVSFHTELQQLYIDDEDVENVPSQANGLTELSIPDPIKLTRESSEEIENYVVKISESEKFKTYDEYEVSGKEELELYNLKVGTKYYWTVQEKDNELTSSVATFRTSDDGIRNLYIDKVTNSRDIGGKHTKTGGIVKQGNIFRTANADNISQKGIEQFKELGVKTEIDLRDSNSRKVSPLGQDINYFAYQMYYNDYSNYLERNCEAVRRTIQEFAYEENYPIFYHCRIGTDRTGIITYLLLGLFGVDEEDIYRDYLFSNFGVIEDVRTLHGSGVNNVQLYYEAINAFPGSTLQEHVYNFLLSIGVSSFDLDEIIRINVSEKEKIKVLENKRALFVNGTKFNHSEGLTSNIYNGLTYYPLSEKLNQFVSIDVESSKACDADIYVYLYSNNLTFKASSAYSLKLNETELEVSNKTFEELHCRSTTGIYVAAKFAEAKLPQGNSKITLTNISSTENSTGKGGNIAGIVVIPKTESNLKTN